MSRTQRWRLQESRTLPVTVECSFERAMEKRDEGPGCVCSGGMYDGRAFIGSSVSDDRSNDTTVAG